ncbi:sulfotransferase family 2 domain-containing protein [Hazenella sp. IB182353]|uniref:sulfotransferase family 2 domain-containing protein n=1 Tax=Polycladospora coralii TaxID=2771432 RepID=UPI001746C37A|nr:sulfotransferase family 2 domain-containing protein [Polycladospora coralii]MBS7530020.1 sulfotransferase family 2 domain-containing protein [Polycladospora coralii]
MSKKLLIFTHIPKTGGITMRSIVHKQFKPHEILHIPINAKINKLNHMSPMMAARIKCAYGHSRFGVHHYFPHTHVQYMTMLRDPLSRILSAYYFIRSSRVNNLKAVVSQMSFEDFIQSKIPRIANSVSNHQTRFLSGKNNPDLTLALHNMDKYFSFVGITELYPHSVFLLNHQMHWKQRAYSKENVTRKKPKHTPLSSKTISYIKQKNAMDYQLYQTALERLKQEIDQLSPLQRLQLRRFVSYHGG